MKIKINIKSILFMTIIAIASLLFINISFAANTGKIIVETAKLREEPNTDSKVLELASEGEEVEVLEETEGWYKVKYKKITGYIRSDLMKVENKEETNITDTNVTTENAATENVTTENLIPENNAAETSTEPVEENIEKGKYKLLENTKLKIIPLISAIELDEVAKDTEIEVTEVLNDWAKIKTADGKEGWIIRRKTMATGEILVTLGMIETTENSDNNASTTDNTTVSNNETTNTVKIMYVNSQLINVREKADKTSQVIKQLSINAQVTVLSSENGWAYVDIEGTKGYIAENLLSSTKQETSRGTTTTRTETTSKTNTTEAIENKTTETVATSNTNVSTTTPTTTSSVTGSSVVSYAQQFLGCKYVYGGTTTSGFDCSGFTQYVYKHFGITLNRTAAAQYSNGISVTNLQPGDLVMFGKSGINHVGIYIGGNSFIHAANSSRGVTTDTLASGYYKTNYVGARRIL